MSDILIGVIVFGLVFGAAIFGMFLGIICKVLEQKVNASDKLSDADKFDLQLRKRSVAPTELYALMRCDGSLTTFKILA